MKRHSYYFYSYLFVWKSKCLLFGFFYFLFSIYIKFVCPCAFVGETIKSCLFNLCYKVVKKRKKKKKKLLILLTRKAYHFVIIPHALGIFQSFLVSVHQNMLWKQQEAHIKVNQLILASTLYYSIRSCFSCLYQFTIFFFYALRENVGELSLLPALLVWTHSTKLDQNTQRKFL